MICRNDRAREWKDRLEAAAHVRTNGVRVVILDPKFDGEHGCPVYRNGTIRMPACIFEGGTWERTWRHELQHAADDRSGLMRFLTRDESERRARAAETAEPREFWS